MLNGGRKTLHRLRRTEKSRHDSPLSSIRGNYTAPAAPSLFKGAGWPANNNSFYVAVTSRDAQRLGRTSARDISYGVCL